jgi:hypothetical protein
VLRPHRIPGTPPARKLGVHIRIDLKDCAGVGVDIRIDLEDWTDVEVDEWPQARPGSPP